jgi:hypothetical protein
VDDENTPASQPGPAALLPTAERQLVATQALNTVDHGSVAHAPPLAGAFPSSHPPPSHPPPLMQPPADHKLPELVTITELRRLLAAVTATTAAAPAHSASSVSDSTTGALILPPPNPTSRAGSFPRARPTSHAAHASDATPLDGAVPAAGMYGPGWVGEWVVQSLQLAGCHHLVGGCQEGLALTTQ